MGLKSGSRDAGLDEEEPEGSEEEAAEMPADAEESAEGQPQDKSGTDESVRSDEQSATGTAGVTGAGASTNSSGRPSMDSIPYKLRRSRVNEGREQVPFFLREEVLDGEEELQESLEAMLGEDVYKSDYREAAMIVAQRNPELVAEVLRDWGYDLD